MLKRQNRLTKRGSFNFVYNKGARKRDGFLTLVYVSAKTLRIGFSVSNKLGNAVVRNKLKRRLRAICLKQTQSIKPVQAVIIAKKGAESLSFDELQLSINQLFKKAELVIV